MANLKVDSGIGDFFLKRAVETFNPMLAQLILINIAEGKTITELKAQKLIPYYINIECWAMAFPDFKEQYLKAKELGASNMAMQLLDIADDETISSEMRKAKIDVRKWLAGKHNQTYQDKQVIQQDNMSKLPPDELERRKQELLERVALLVQGMDKD